MYSSFLVISVAVTIDFSTVAKIQGNVNCMQKHISVLYIKFKTAVAQWLRCCATNRKVAGSIPAGVSGFFINIKSF